MTGDPTVYHHAEPVVTCRELVSWGIDPQVKGEAQAAGSGPHNFPNPTILLSAIQCYIVTRPYQAATVCGVFSVGAWARRHTSAAAKAPASRAEPCRTAWHAQWPEHLPHVHSCFIICARARCSTLVPSPSCCQQWAAAGCFAPKWHTVVGGPAAAASCAAPRSCLSAPLFLQVSTYKHSKAQTQVGSWASK